MFFAELKPKVIPHDALLFDLVYTLYVAKKIKLFAYYMEEFYIVDTRNKVLLMWRNTYFSYDLTDFIQHALVCFILYTSSAMSTSFEIYVVV